MQSRSQRIHLSVPHMGGTETAYVQDAFARNWLSTVGPNLDALEARFRQMVGQPAVALVNGTAALHLGYRLLGVSAGDEVVTPSLTFAASCNPIVYQGGRPVFMDSDRETWNLDPNRLEEFLARRAAVNRLPKAVSVVHLFGQSADMGPILALCTRYEILVIEDAAESLGARYRGMHPGSLGAIGVFSLNGNKMITATSGGVLVSAREDWIDKARFWSTQARDQDPLGVRNYVHSELGYNYRMSNVLAGIALGQLEVLDLRVQQRRAVFERYQAAFADLPGIQPQPEADFGERGAGSREQGAGSREQGAGSREQGAPSSELRAPSSELQAPSSELQAPSSELQAPSSRLPSLHTRWLSCFLIDEEEFGMSSVDLIRFLDAANIESRPVWKPMHIQPLYRGYECVGGEVAEDLNRRGICLPSSSSLSAEDQQFVIERVREAQRRSRGS